MLHQSSAWTKFILITCHLLLASCSNAVSNNTITWRSCPDVNENITKLAGVRGSTFDCATLAVPLDYTDPNSQTLQLSLFKLNATQQPVLGSVLVNFGGPGGTGAENLPTAGAQVAKFVGPQWNILSWDPRGTGKTIPFDCKLGLFSSSSQQSKRETLVSSNLTELFLKNGWDTAGAIADACYKAMNDTGRFISTTSTARDVINIVDALGEDGLLRYWGWSYGTALGAYIAAMYPKRVERMVLDGNLNPWDYQSGTFRNSALDVDKAFQGFLKECLNNKQECSLATYTNANETDDMVSAINKISAPQAANITDALSYITHPPISTIIQGYMYDPSTWPGLADELTSFLNGSYSPISYSPVSPPKDSYNLGFPWSPYGIRGADAIWQPKTIEEYLPQVQYDTEISPFIGTYIATWVSARWRITPKDRYHGGFNASTKHPILLVNGEYDPVTPIDGAYNSSTGFAKSVVLAHTGYGHGIPTDPSQCVLKYTTAYFLDGTLPDPGTVCHPDQTPWALAKALRGSTSNGTSENATASGTAASPTSATMTTITPSIIKGESTIASARNCMLLAMVLTTFLLISEVM